MLSVISIRADGRTAVQSKVDVAFPAFLLFKLKTRFNIDNNSRFAFSVVSMKLILAAPLTAALFLRAWRRSSLTPAGIFTAVLTAIAHAYHPWNLPFLLLAVFFLAGTRVTHIKEKVKATLTQHSNGSSGGEGPRTHVQVLANSLIASILSILHSYQLRSRQAAYANADVRDPVGTTCFSWGGDVLVIGIIANYAAVAADTFSSELGILSRTQPRLITSLTLRKVPRGTNGGVTIEGLVAGVVGSMIIVMVAMIFLPTCTPETAAMPGGGVPWTVGQRRILMGFLIVWGALGSLLDSVLGGLLQRSVRDVRSGKIVEGEGGNRVLVSESSGRAAGGSVKRAEAKVAALSGLGEKPETNNETAVDDEHDTTETHENEDKHRRGSFGDDGPSRIVESGLDLLDNNDVNFLMATTMSVGGMALASWYWGLGIENVLRP
ncbi:hypothetical protein L249_0993 [Ophiocordyceps polyrhachis-furcata BCC 54312]|uniref:DUF92 domain-containing protein n=1 Tax=Ophiocordyceps polyrhachis-furcata BCC 54312 TaxID=1330021 RepID=A0A367LF51_9HYPO|nr:hypothetical protein L249_0993 [Ophiocordyceps polyrhachis-furcata BCC 54312]